MCTNTLSALSALLGVVVGWLLSILTNMYWNARARKSSLSTIMFYVKFARDELKALSDSIASAQMEDQPDLVLTPQDILGKKFMFQTMDLSQFSPNFWLFKDSFVNLLVNFSRTLHIFNLRWEELMRGQYGSVKQVMNLSDDKISVQKKEFLRSSKLKLNEVITLCDKILESRDV